MSGTVEFDVTGQGQGVALVTLSHQGKFNAMSRAMWRELLEGFVSLQADRDVRCVVVRGADGNFCAGGDISEYADFRFQEESLRAFHEKDVWGGLQAMLDCDVPIVAQIEGHCMGAGVEVACCCDIRIASAAARFGAPIARLGFPMAPRETELVLREAGALTLRSMLLQAAVLSAADMQARGFLTQVVEVGQCASAVNAAAKEIAALAPGAARMNKRNIRLFQDGNVASALVKYAQHAIDPVANEMTRSFDDAYTYASSEEHREGVTAFVEKRKPVF